MRTKFKSLMCLCLSLITVASFASCGKSSSQSSSNSIIQSSYAAYDMNKYGNTPANLQNGGTFVEKNGEIFYNNGLKQNALYVYDEASKTHKKLSDLKATSLNADTEYLYFIDSSSRTHRLKQDGSVDQILFNGAFTGSLFLYDGTLYFTNRAANVCSSNTDGGNMKTLTVYPVTNMQIYEGKIYFCDDTQHICRMDTSGSFSKIGDVTATHFFINNNFIYFVDANANFPGKYTLDGTKGVFFSDSPCDNLNLSSDNKLYYRDMTAGALMSRDVNAQGYIEISKDKCDQVSILGDNVYYVNPTLLNTPRIFAKGAKSAADFFS